MKNRLGTMVLAGAMSLLILVSFSQAQIAVEADRPVEPERIDAVGPGQISLGFNDGLKDCDGKEPHTAECNGLTTTVQLYGSGSFDPFGDQTTYEWTTDCPGGVFDDNTWEMPWLTVDTGRAGAACLVACEATLKVGGPAGEYDYCKVAVNIVDTLPPSITCSIDNADNPIEVNDKCEATVEFTAVITDNCCVDVDNLNLVASAVDLSGNAVSVENPPTIVNVNQDNPNQVTVTGTVLVSGLTGCPADIAIRVQADDCCGNTGDTGLGLYGASHDGRDGPSTLWVISPSTGFATMIGPIGFERVSGMDRSADGTLYATGERMDGSDEHVLITIDTSSGAGTEVGPTGVLALGFFQGTISDISFRNADGVLYAASIGDVATINTTTGAATAVGANGLFAGGNGIAFSPGDTLFLSDDLALRTLNQINGAATLVAPMGFSPPADDFPRINAMDFQPGTGVLFGSLNDKVNRGSPPENYLATVDIATGVVTIIGPTVDGLDALAFSAGCVATIVDKIDPVITCPRPITLERGDKLCNDDVQDWLDSTTATDNCDTDVDIVDDSADNGFACGFPYDSTTTVVWEATDDCENVSTCDSTITIGPAERVDSTAKGSLLVMSKIEIKWDAAGNVTQDTFIDLANDYPDDVVVQMYFINGDTPTDAVEVGIPPVVVERAHPGWNWVDCQIMLTKDQPTYWSALTGSNSHGGVCQPFTVLDPGSPPGRPDPDGPPGSRLLRGYVYAWAVNNAGEEIRWNHLKADVVLVNYEHTAAWEYNAYALTASCVDHGDQPSDCINFDDNGVCCKAEVIAGRLDSDGFQYALSFDKLLLDFYASGSDALSDGGATVQVDTDLTLFPVSADLRQDTHGPVHTKANFDIWNQNEVRLSGTHRCISCWDQTLLSKYTEIANHFLRGNLQTDKGKARIDGQSSNVCEENPGACDEFRDCLRNGEDPLFATAGGARGFFDCRHDIFDEEGLPFDCTVFDPLLGVSAKILMFSGTASGRAYAGSNLVGQGEENARILYDIIEPPDELIIGPRDGAPMKGDVTNNPRINRTPAGASKRGR